MWSPDDAFVQRIRDALLAGELGTDDLSTRRLGALAGKTTSLVYARYGSLDGLLFAVSQSGLALLSARLADAEARGADLPELAVAFVRFGLEAPPLYAVMFERRFDWAALRRAGALSPEHPGARLFSLVADRLAAGGARDATRDARILFAGLHGLVSLASSGRANIGQLDVTDEAAALDAARELAQRLLQGRNHARHSRPAASARRRHAAKPRRQERDERAPRRSRRRSD